MHHSNKNLLDANEIDVPQAGVLESSDINMPSASFVEYIDSDQFSITDKDDAHSDSDSDIQDAESVSENRNRNKTLFNIRLTSLGKRVSDRLESGNGEPDCIKSDDHKPDIKNVKKSRKGGHVAFDTIPETVVIEFVQQKAVKFGRGISCTDVSFPEVFDYDDSDDCSDSCEDPDSSADSNPGSWVLVQPNDLDTVSDTPPEKQERTEVIAGEESENRSHFRSNIFSSLFSRRKQRNPLQTTSKNLLEKTSSLLSFADSDDSSPLRVKYSSQDNLRTVSPISLRAVQEKSLAENSASSNTIESEDNAYSSSPMTVDNVKLDRTSSYLSDDCSSPTSLSSYVEDKENKKPRLSSEKSLSEQSLNLEATFTEFVNIEDFRTTLGSQKPHTGSILEAKYKNQLEVLLKTGTNKGLKAYLRSSQWPAESGERHCLWESLCKHLLKAEKNLYHKLVNDMLSEETESSELPSIVDPSRSHCYYLTASGVEHAKTVVNLISHLHPDITYCPILYPMACLFLHYMSPETCFNTLQALLSSTKSCYFTQTKIKTEASKLVLKDLAKKYAKQAHDLMARSATSVEAVFDNWMWWIFRDLPFQYLVRIVDSFLLEGYKIFYRISLAIVILFAKGYSSRQGSLSVPDIHADLSRFCKNMSFDPRKLIQVGFGIRGLSRKEIAKLHEKNELYLISMPVSSTPMGGPRLREHVSSTILTPEMLQNIWQWIPLRLSLMKLTLLFCSNEHGTAIRTLYSRTEHAPQTIMIIKTTSNEIFGAFCSTSWFTRHEKNKPKTSFFGTGETFVFSLSPEMKRYPWSGMLDLFMAGDDQMLNIGSGNGTAIYLDAMMNRCISTHCDTFDNEPLCMNLDFSCRVVEVFGFTE